MTWKNTTHVCLTVLSLGALACSQDEGGTGLPWSDQRTQVVTSDRSITSVSPAEGDSCVQYEKVCLQPAERCGREAADIVLDREGRVLDILCYPGDATITVEQLEASSGDIAQRDNNTVLVLDDAADGVDIVGDVSIDANNVVIYGDTADNAVIGGGLKIDGNNTLVRGVRIQGDVVVAKNDATLAFCVIEGNLTIPANNTRVLACDVLGDIIISGNNTQLYGNHVAGSVTTQGQNTDCKDNVAAADVNADLRLAPGELGAALTCS